jgi:6-phosphogluconolactonase
MPDVRSRIGAACWVLLAAGAPAIGGEPARAATVYVGTYTDGASRGIYRFRFELASGAAGAPALAAETKNPSFLALHPGGHFLYAVGESDGFLGRPTGALSAFRIDAPSGDLTLLDQQPSEGRGPCHLVVDRAERHLLAANYGGGTVAVLPIATDGRLGPATSVRVHEGTGPNRERQEHAHAHGIYLDPSERFALAPDLGADRIFVYRFDSGAGRLEPSGAAALPPGSGPRHLAFAPSGRRLFVVSELLSTLSVFSYDAATGHLRERQTLSTLAKGFSGANTAAEVAVSRDGRFVYTSNRGDDSLAVFAIAEDGRLTAQGTVAAGGRTPRHFTLDPSGRFLLVALQGSDRIVVFRLDPATGRPADVVSTISVPKPVCLLFAAAGR